MTVMEDVYYFTLISGGKLARDHLSICSKYLGKPEKNRGEVFMTSGEVQAMLFHLTIGKRDFGSRDLGLLGK